MKILILGGDGYLGWPTAMRFSAYEYDVCVVDNYLRRNIARQTDSEALIPNPNLHERARIWNEKSGYSIEVEIGDCADFSFMSRVVRDFQPDVIVHFAEQPSAPYSMLDFDAARLTLNNNVNSTLNVIWSVIQFAPDCHIIKLGTMGEYGTPNIDIEEGWLSVDHNGRSDTFLYPRQAGSLYHTTKILDTDLLWFYVRLYGIKVTDLMQGPVYGLLTPEVQQDSKLYTNFHYDDIFGTVINRFLIQAVAGVPLTVYGEGGQTRGYLNLLDTLQCIELAVNNTVKRGELRILNQFTEQFSVMDIAEKIKRVGSDFGVSVTINKIKNPRKENENHYYNAKHSTFLDLGLKPHLLTDDVIYDLLGAVSKYKDNINMGKVMPRVTWNR